MVQSLSSISGVQHLGSHLRSSRKNPRRESKRQNIFIDPASWIHPRDYDQTRLSHKRSPPRPQESTPDKPGLNTGEK